MQLNADTFLAFWNAEPLELATATDKLAYRVIDGKKFQFRKVDYKKRTALVLEIMAVAKGLAPLIDQLEGKEDLSDTQLGAEILPQVLETIATPKMQALVDQLVGTAYVDRGSGTFESLADEVIGEALFGPDITLQVPVALTAALFNLDSVVKKFG